MSGNNLPLTKATAQSPRAEFVSVYGGIYEHSPWVAEGAYAALAAQGGGLTVPTLHAAMKAVVEAASRDLQMALVRAHPDLACKPAELGKLTQSSVSEQKGAGLDQCSPEEFAEFQQLNADYRAKFGFPFIIAVKGLGRLDILQAFRARIHHDPETEFRTALDQIHKIALFRLTALAQ